MTHRLSKVLVAVWIALCSHAELTLCSRVINKPLLSLTLARFGFTPANRRAQTIQVGGERAGKGSRPMPWKVQRLVQPSTRDMDTGGAGHDAEAKPRTAFVRTAFEPPEDKQMLEQAAHAVLAGRLNITASGDQLRRALTLRGGGGAFATSHL